MSQHHLASLTAAVVPKYSPLSYILLLFISKYYQWKCVEVSLHSHRLSLAPSKKRPDRTTSEIRPISVASLVDATLQPTAHQVVLCDLRPHLYNTYIVQKLHNNVGVMYTTYFYTCGLRTSSY